MKSVTALLNPLASSHEEVEGLIRAQLGSLSPQFDLQITTHAGHAEEVAREAVAKKVELIVVHGGDGTVMEVARAVKNSGTALVILPGGTANVLAKELGLPLDPRTVLDELMTDQLQEKNIDMGIINAQPFMLRVNFGIFATMITETTREQKNQFGIISYVASALEQLQVVEETEYTLTFDGVERVVSGIGLMIANTANLGIGGLRLEQSVLVDDGKLDALLVTKADLPALVSLAGTSLVEHIESPFLKHWQFSVGTVVPVPVGAVICDDEAIEPPEFQIQVIPKSLKVLVPKI